MVFGTYPIDHRLHSTVDQLDNQHEYRHTDQQNTFDAADVQQEDQRQEDHRQKQLLTEGCFVTNCRLNAVKRVNSRESDSSDSRILLHAMTTLIHFPVCTRMKHNVLKRSRGMMTSLLLSLVSFTGTVPTTIHAADQPPLVALASSFRDLWPELSQLYTEQTGQPAPRTSFASSGLLSTQIRHGAPFELYLSADESTVRMLFEAGKTRDAGVLLAYGTLSLIALSDANESTLQPPPALSLLSDKLEHQQDFKVAIPNPRHAPYGKAAREALQSAGLWPLPTGHLLNAENAAQTFQFALTGAVDYAIVPDTLLHNATPALGTASLPIDSYQPVIHKMVLLESASPEAEQLFNWLQQAPAAAVLARYGLTPAH